MCLRATLIAAIAGTASFVTALDAVAEAAPVTDTGSLEFDVYLDDSRIGVHRYEFSVDGGDRKVRSQAKFDVKFLFISAFKYRHELEEQWSGDCLESIEAETNSNGERTVIVGERKSDAFVVETSGEEKSLPRCVMTFAYWNPDFLAEPRLLNPQTGRYLEVDVEDLGEKTMQVSGRDHAVHGYTIRGEDFEVTVWYSTRDEAWLALESPARGGRTLRYELT